MCLRTGIGQLKSPLIHCTCVSSRWTNLVAKTSLIPRILWLPWKLTAIERRTFMATATALNRFLSSDVASKMYKRKRKTLGESAAEPKTSSAKTLSRQRAGQRRQNSMDTLKSTLRAKAKLLSTMKFYKTPSSYIATFPQRWSGWKEFKPPLNKLTTSWKDSTATLVGSNEAANASVRSNMKDHTKDQFCSLPCDAIDFSAPYPKRTIWTPILEVCACVLWLCVPLAWTCLMYASIRYMIYPLLAYVTWYMLFDRDASLRDDVHRGQWYLR